MIVALAGGVGGARFLRGLVEVVPPSELTVIGNTGDDFVLHGLSISPDLDTVMYTLAGVANPETGWGLAGETFAAMEALELYGGESWFRLGDRDLGTHLYRTQRLSEGATLSQVTADMAAARKLVVRLLPMSDDPVRTRVQLADGPEVEFQDYFVRRGHQVRASGLRYEGAERAAAAPGVLESLQEALAIVICPSNPLLSVGPVRAVTGVEEVLAERRERAVAVSPIIAGAAVRGPADRLLTELGHEPSVVGVARLYAPIAAALVIDGADRELASAVEAEGLRCVVTETLMTDLERTKKLAAATLAAVVEPGGRT